MAYLPQIRRLPQRKPARRGGRLPPAPSEIAYAIEQRVTQIADIAVRQALRTSRTVRLFGARFAVANTAFWKNEHAYPVTAAVLVTKAGPLGAVVTVDGVDLPADTPGGRSAYTALDPNDSLPILFSSAAIEAVLIIHNPRSPLG